MSELANCRECGATAAYGGIPMGVDGLKLIANRALWKRAVCQYERQHFVDQVLRFHHTSEAHCTAKAALEAYDAETKRMLEDYR